MLIDGSNRSSDRARHGIDNPLLENVQASTAVDRFAESNNRAFKAVLSWFSGRIPWGYLALVRRRTRDELFIIDITFRPDRRHNNES